MSLLPREVEARGPARFELSLAEFEEEVEVPKGKDSRRGILIVDGELAVITVGNTEIVC